MNTGDQILKFVNINDQNSQVAPLAQLQPQMQQRVPMTDNFMKSSFDKPEHLNSFNKNTNQQNERGGNNIQKQSSSDTHNLN